MKKFLIAGALLAGLSAPAFAQSLSIGGGFQNGVSQTSMLRRRLATRQLHRCLQPIILRSGRASLPRLPAGNVTAGLGASVGSTGSASGAATGPGGGIAAATGHGSQSGAGLGFGFAN